MRAGGAVGHSLVHPNIAGRFAPDPHPNPSPGGEGLAAPFSHREKVARKPDEGAGASLVHPNIARRCAPDPLPNPSPGGEGLKRQYFFSTLNIQVWSLPLSPSVTPRYSTRVDRPWSVLNTTPTPSISRLRSYTLCPVRYRVPPTMSA